MTDSPQPIRALRTGGTRSRRAAVWLVTKLPRDSRLRFEALLWLRPLPTTSASSSERPS